MEQLPGNGDIKEKLTLIRKYIYEIILVILCFAVFRLFNSYQEIDATLKKYLFEDREKMIRLQENTNSILRTIEHR